MQALQSISQILGRVCTNLTHLWFYMMGPYNNIDNIHPPTNLSL